MVNPNDFQVQYPIGMGRTLDYEKIAALGNEEFLSLHVQLMEEYRHNGWWTEKNIPSCNQCQDPIPGPETLIRYFGQSYDPSCFKDAWRSEREYESRRNPGHGKYLDRIVDLLVNNAS